MNPEWRKSAPPQLIQYRIVHDSMEWVDPEVWEYDIYYLQTKPERKSYGECKAILSKDTLLINKKKSNIDEIKIKYIKRVSRQHDVIKFSTKKHFDEKKKHIITSEKAAEFVEKLLFLKERNRLKKKALTIQGYKSQVHKQKKKRHSEISNMRIKSKDENIIDLESSDKD